MEVLEKVEILDKIITNNLQYLEELDLKLIGISSVKYGDKIQTSKNGNNSDFLICKIDEIKQKICKDIELLYKYKKAICDKIMNLEDDRMAMVLYMRYIEFKSLKEIAEELGLSYSYIKSLHTKGLQNFYK